ncbi:MAG: hypothetical protein KGZ90_15520 [Algoriphagus sp.]|nr:hypothetical protein [Algoriphagus sp.]
MINILLILFLSLGLMFAGINSTSYGGGSRVFMLMALIMLVINPTIKFYSKQHKWKIRKSTSFLILFYLYFLCKLVYDTGDISQLAANVYAPTGGLVVFYFTGLIVNNALKRLERRHTSELLVSVLLGGIFLISIFVYGIYNDNQSIISLDFFQLVEKRDDYQKIGNYLSISYIVLSYLILQSFYLFNKNTVFFKIFKFFIILFYLYIGVMLSLLSQMYESNSGFIFILVTLLYSLYCLSMKSVNEYSGGVVISRIGNRITIYFRIGLIFIVSSIAIFYFITQVFNVDVFKMRIFNYGLSSSIVPRSVESRIEVLSNYSDQLNYSPIFGNMIVDELTSGPGTYAHSMILSIQSHLGLFGFILFLLYISFYFKENKISLQSLVSNRKRNMESFKVGFVLIAIVFASISTFFTWPIVWFSLALSKK